MNKLQILAKAVQLHLGVSPLNTSAKRVYVTARKLYVFIAVNKIYRPISNPEIECPGISPISRMIGKDHSTINFYFKEAIKHLEFESNFRMDYAVISRRFDAMLKEKRITALEPCEFVGFQRILKQNEKSLLIGIS